jgi:hypothetical protein
LLLALCLSLFIAMAHSPLAAASRPAAAEWLHRALTTICTPGEKVVVKALQCGNAPMPRGTQSVCMVIKVYNLALKSWVWGPQWHHANYRGLSGTMQTTGASVAPCKLQGPQWHHANYGGLSGTMQTTGASVAPCKLQGPQWRHHANYGGLSGTMQTTGASVAPCKLRRPQWHHANLGLLHV